MLVVGLTGNIASGKSTVAQLLVQHGARLIDADLLARRAVEVGSPGLKRITERWGSGVLNADGSLDRSALRRIVFGNRAEREALNAIVHPEVERLRQHDLARARVDGVRVAVCDIPLLFEAALESTVDRIVLVDAPADVRLARLTSDRHLSRQEAESMMAAQLPAESKRSRAHYVIANDGTLEELRDRVAAIWVALAQESAAQSR